MKNLREEDGRECDIDLNERQRRFAELVVEGRPAGRAYEEAGFKARGASADTEASKSLRNPKIAAYIASLRADASARAMITRERLIDILTETITSRPMDASMSNPLCEVKMGKNGPYATFPDKMRCIERLVKILGWEKISVVVRAGNSGLSVMDLLMKAQHTSERQRDET